MIRRGDELRRGGINPFAGELYYLLPLRGDELRKGEPKCLIQRLRNRSLHGVPVQLERQVELQPLDAPVRLTAPVASLQHLAEAGEDPIQPLARQAAELRVRSP